jgi:dTDP-4-amino-4,6-dideoxygalactose transaminase
VLDAGAGIGLNLRLHELASALGLAQVRKLDTILARCRATKAVLRDGLAELPGARERVVHDVVGDCATTHTLIFDDPAVARRVAADLGGDTLARSPKHNYARMAQLHPVLAGSAVSNGSPGALPRTDDILSRAVGLSVGVVDGYLGTLGGVTILDPPEVIVEKAGHIREVVERAAAA